MSSGVLSKPTLGKDRWALQFRWSCDRPNECRVWYFGGERDARREFEKRKGQKRPVEAALFFDRELIEHWERDAE